MSQVKNYLRLNIKINEYQVIAMLQIYKER